MVTPITNKKTNKPKDYKIEWFFKTSINVKNSAGYCGYFQIYQGNFKW